MKKVKVLALVISIVLCFSVVVGANQGRGNDNNPSQEPNVVEVDLDESMTVVSEEAVTLEGTTKKNESSSQDIGTDATAKLDTVLVDGLNAVTGDNDNPSHEPNVVEVDLDESITVNVGDDVTLTATTQKHGSYFEDSWTDAEKIDTVLVDGYYVATASFDTSEAGEFVVTYNIAMGAGESHITFVGEATITITVVATDNDGCPAAPAVASELLKNAGINPRYGSGATGGNYISDVAQHMGSETDSNGTDFNGVSKCDTGYEEAVKEFLNVLLGENGEDTL